MHASGVQRAPAPQGHSLQDSIRPHGILPAQPLRQRSPIDARRTKRCQRFRPVPLGKALAIGCQQQRVVMIAGRGKIQQRLQKALDVGCLKQIARSEERRVGKEC